MRTFLPTIDSKHLLPISVRDRRLVANWYKLGIYQRRVIAWNTDLLKSHSVFTSAGDLDREYAGKLNFLGDVRTIGELGYLVHGEKTSLSMFFAVELITTTTTVFKCRVAD